jgi:hypothetical protein
METRLKYSGFDSSPEEFRTLAKHDASVFSLVKSCSDPGRSISKFKLVSVSSLSEKLNLGMSEGMVKIGARVYQ